MSKYSQLTLGITNAVCAVANIITQNWDALVVNIIICVLCLSNFIESE